MTDDRKSNGESRAEDFLLPEPLSVTLPSGLKAVLRPPGWELWLRLGELPARLATSMGSGESGVGSRDTPLPTPDARRPNLPVEEIVVWSYRIIAAVFVEPKFSLEPAPGEYHPARLRPADIAFIERWVGEFLPGGDVGASGARPGRTPFGPTGGGVGAIRESPLQTFRAQSSEPAADGAGSEPLWQGAE